MFQILKKFFSSPFDEFCEQSKPLSHPQHLLLHPGHSPNSRVPCTDVLSFITKMLMEGRIDSIKKLMRLLVVGNPLGTGADWTSTAIDTISRWDLKSYIHFNDERAEYDFKAMCILFEKNGGGREFWITESPDYSELASRAMSGYLIIKVGNFQALTDKANSFIKKMRKDNLPYWSNFHLFKPEEITIENLNGQENNINFCKFSIPTRLFLMDQANSSSAGFSLLQIPKSEIKYLGYNTKETSNEILNSGIMKISDDHEILLQSFNQGMLFQMCQERGYDIKKSWKRDKLLQILLDKDPIFKANFIEKNKPAKFDPEEKVKLEKQLAIATNRKKAIQLLFFV